MNLQSIGGSPETGKNQPGPDYRHGARAASLAMPQTRPVAGRESGMCAGVLAFKPRLVGAGKSIEAELFGE